MISGNLSNTPQFQGLSNVDDKSQASEESESLLSLSPTNSTENFSIMFDKEKTVRSIDRVQLSQNHFKVNESLARSAIKAMGIFLVKSVTSLVVIALFVPAVAIELFLRALPLNNASLLTYAILPATFAASPKEPTAAALWRTLSPSTTCDIPDSHDFSISKIDNLIADSKYKLEAYKVCLEPIKELRELADRLTNPQAFKNPTSENATSSTSTNEKVDNATKRLVISFCPNEENCRNRHFMSQAIEDTLKTKSGTEHGLDHTDFIFFNYRGVGESQGQATQLGDLVSDGKAVLKWALDQGYKESNIQLYGQSIGGGVASVMAKEHPEAHVQLIHTFTSWSSAAENITQKVAFAPIAKVVSMTLPYIVGELSPEKNLNERFQQHEITHLKTNQLGSVWIERAVHDSMLGEAASLKIQDISKPHQADVTYIESQVDHLQRMERHT